MANYLRAEVERLKNHYIAKLLDYGVYKLEDQQLYNLTLTDLEEIYLKETKGKSS
ncbi:Fur-regulated basic protein FbpA [Heyndrickxia acidicola]|uniref:Fur-regulated basic protein FbpA n=1 Tax=Heyndrickxia acidicola TaxID=209389 RepID=A0ABU6MH68_9BACI|nr:Fur-regulated basic protein FbpA [Heyndrickxia acidicola]MED1204019.1 Fur-regulated basic protein FbpA [Heyndrickxia acidicola]